MNDSNKIADIYQAVSIQNTLSYIALHISSDSHTHQRMVLSFPFYRGIRKLTETQKSHNWKSINY